MQAPPMMAGGNALFLVLSMRASAKKIIIYSIAVDG
jgi:hypothetical protein